MGPSGLVRCAPYAEAVKVRGCPDEMKPARAGLCANAKQTAAPTRCLLPNPPPPSNLTGQHPTACYVQDPLYLPCEQHPGDCSLQNHLCGLMGTIWGSVTQTECRLAL